MEPAPTRVLLVDDDTDTLKMYSFALELMGCSVTTADSATGALRKMSHAKPDVVVTDLAMPGMDGVEFCRVLKAQTETRDLPILAVSGQAIAGFDQRARDAGCREVLLKPCLPEDLYASIQRVLDVPASTTEPGEARGRRPKARTEATPRKRKVRANGRTLGKKR